MQDYEYSVIPAPTRGEKSKGLKTPADRYAHVLTAEINRMAAEGWEYLRAETLPSEERSGLTGRSTVYNNLLVFRRAIRAAKVAQPEPAAPGVAAAQPEPPAAPQPAASKPAKPPFTSPAPAETPASEPATKAPASPSKEA